MQMIKAAGRFGVLVFVLLALSAFAESTTIQGVHIDALAAVARAKLVGALPESNRLNLAIGLPLRNREGLTNLLAQIYNPSSPQYRHYLTPEQFAARFGPTAGDYQSVIQFARSHGLAVTGTHPNRMLLDVSGTVGEIERAFRVHLRTYQHPTEARVFYAPDIAPSVNLAVPVLGVSGLDNFNLARPMNLKTRNWNSASNATAFFSGSGPGGFFIGGDFRAAYAPGVNLTGVGQAVGLFELDGYHAGDIVEYESLARLAPVPLTNVLMNGFSGAAGNDNLEVALDIDMAISMAPGLAQVIVYEGAVPNDILNRMATDNLASQLSCSWGFGSPADPVRDQIFLEFAAQGQSMFQASGDDGAYPGAIYPPADNPNLTVVGGTALTTSGPGGVWAKETVWPGSGGGTSESFAIPAWQQSVDMAANHGSTAWRNIPDVACLADTTIWLVANNGQQGGVGGTSASAPLWAGFAALANEQAATLGRPPVGFLNPALYAIGGGSGYAADFHDITSGNNTNSGSPTNFFAVPGYDLCTGWGSPTGSNLIQALVAPPDALQTLPDGNAPFTLIFGGSFSLLSESVFLTNSGTVPLSWLVANDAPWLDVTPGSGTLAPGGAVTAVTLKLNPTVTNFAVGVYDTALWFTNLNNGFAQSRQIILDIVNPPTIATQPTNATVPLGATVTFTVSAVANPVLFYQWWAKGNPLTDGGNLSGSMTGTLTISNVMAADAGSYFSIVSNPAGSVSSRSVSLAITSSPPVILTQPASQTAIPGAAVTFSVVAEGDQPMSYQWQLNGANLAEGGSIAGSRSNLLTLENIISANAGTYSVLVSNGLGSVSSAGADLEVVSGMAPGVTLASLYSFSGGVDGGNPNELVQSTNGSFYGTTQTGGTNSSGTVFEMDASGAINTVAWFNGADGGGFSPQAGLVQGGDGAFYGTTTQGGDLGWGTVFRVTGDGALTPLVNLTYADGALVDSRMIAGPGGDLYGTASNGGGGGAGTIFKVALDGTFTVLLAFDYTNGFQPTELVNGLDGAFYGTTLVGGTNGDGTVYRFKTNGVLTSLDSFNYTNGGFLPFGGLVQAADGNFYGTTYEGGDDGYGTVFKMSPAGAVSTVYSFTGKSDGAHPAARLTPSGDGNFYGTTAAGGAYHDGTVFRISPTGELLTLAEFDGFNGANPQVALTPGADGYFYGTTQSGGKNGNGTLFRLSIDSAELQLTSQPADQSAFVGAGVTFGVAVAGNAPFTFQWRKNGTNLVDAAGVTGSMSRVLVLTNLVPADAGLYSVVIGNATSSVSSDDALLEVITSPPQIITQPVSQVVSLGVTVTFSVIAIGDLPLSYQWRENGTNLTDGGQVSGAMTQQFSL